MFQVTWIRRKDRQLLTVGRSTHSIDTRFMVVSNSPDWTLLIKNVKHDDAGLYECQVTRKNGVYGDHVHNQYSLTICSRYTVILLT